MTKNEIYTILGLLDQAKAKTAQFMARVLSDINKHPEDEESLKETLIVQTKVYDHYDQCIEDFKKLVEKEAKK